MVPAGGVSLTAVLGTTYAVLLLLTAALPPTAFARHHRKRDTVLDKSSGKSIDSLTSLELQCPSCSEIHCTPRKAKRLKCQGGVTRGICNCCPVCAKVEGEACGGQYDYLGKCDRGLQCGPAHGPAASSSAAKGKSAMDFLNQSPKWKEASKCVKV